MNSQFRLILQLKKTEGRDGTGEVQSMCKGKMLGKLVMYFGKQQSPVQLKNRVSWWREVGIVGKTRTRESHKILALLSLWKWEFSLERKLEPSCRGALLLVLYSANNLWSLKVLELGIDMFIAVISLYKQSSPVGWNFFSLIQLFWRLNFLSLRD